MLTSYSNVLTAYANLSLLSFTINYARIQKYLSIIMVPLAPSDKFCDFLMSIKIT